jgi:molybdopterin-guanine dinucleotide biosynthesis protein A
MPAPWPPFDAVILAGGGSTRMGRDKSGLEVEGRPLLARQIDLVRSLGPRVVFISGRREGDYHPFGCPVVRDAESGVGPLAGLAAAWEASRAPLLLALAVDLPRMNRAVLESLLAACSAGCGAVARVAGRVEPLVAVYPRAAAALVRELLAAGKRAAGELAARCAQAGLVGWVDFPAGQAVAFLNWNRPEDLPDLPAAPGPSAPPA